MKKLLQMSMFTIFVLLLASLSAVGQASTISGTVTDLSDGEPLIGASVIIKGTTTGTITDIDGKYQIAASPGDILSLSYVGYRL